ncbi:ribonuclease II, chloroplastic/mitochondrial-like [Papaver somniferum]|uniref:ribonuclease II, chloroplastic/mitochondrial-like n=1 Tax=Papaver somniferum TaxID=3469 RepID=UPI000E6FA9EB|nr:ribonuclease II, chloroplastic/mitochondrial-like [Papaver somniferum]
MERRIADQNGFTSSIKPQQVTYIIRGVENFNYEEISRFIQKVENNLDPTLLEYAWMELIENPKSVTAEEMAEVEELLRRKEVKEAAEKELQEFAQLLKSANAMPNSSKPRNEFWTLEEKSRQKTEALEAYAIDVCKNDD